MFNHLFDHIKKYKWGYSLGAILILVGVSTLTYFDNYYVNSELSGNARRVVKERNIPSNNTVVDKTEKKNSTKAIDAEQVTTMVEATSNVTNDDTDVPKTDVMTDAVDSNSVLDTTGVPVTNMVEDVAGSMNDATDVPKTDVMTDAVMVNKVAAPSLMVNGERTLITFSVQADAMPPAVSLGGLSFDLDLTDYDMGGELTLESFKLYRGSVLVSDVSIISNMAGNVAPGGSAITSDNKVTVVFKSEETIPDGASQNYSLKASVFGSEENDMIVTTLELVRSSTNMLFEGMPVSHQLGEK